MEMKIREALKQAGVECNNVVEVDPVENDWLITGVFASKERPVAAKIEGHTVPAGKSIIRRLEDAADFQFKKFKAVDSPDIAQYVDNYVLGICDALGIMKNTAGHVEYEAVLDRYQNEIIIGDARIGEPDGQSR